MPRHTNFEEFPRIVDLDLPRTRTHSGPRTRVFDPYPASKYGRGNFTKSKWEEHFSEANYHKRKTSPRSRDTAGSSSPSRYGPMPRTFEAVLGRSPSFEVTYYADGRGDGYHDQHLGDYVLHGSAERDAGGYDQHGQQPDEQEQVHDVAAVALFEQEHERDGHDDDIEHLEDTNTYLGNQETIVSDEQLALVRALLESRRGSSAFPASLINTQVAEAEDDIPFKGEDFAQAVLDYPIPHTHMSHLTDEDDIYDMLGLSKRKAVVNKAPVRMEAFEDPTDLRAIMQREQGAAAAQPPVSPPRVRDALDEILHFDNGATFKPQSPRLVTETAIQTSPAAMSRNMSRRESLPHRVPSTQSSTSHRVAAADSEPVAHNASYITFSEPEKQEESVSRANSRRVSRVGSIENVFRVASAGSASRATTSGSIVRHIAQSQGATPTSSPPIAPLQVTFVDNARSKTSVRDMAEHRIEGQLHQPEDRHPGVRQPEVRQPEVSQPEARQPEASARTPVIDSSLMKGFILEEVAAANTEVTRALLANMGQHLRTLVEVEQRSARTLIESAEEMAFEGALNRFSQGIDRLWMIAHNDEQHAQLAKRSESSPPIEIKFAPVPDSLLDSMAKDIAIRASSENPTIPPELLEDVAKSIAHRASSELQIQNDAKKEERNSKLYEIIQQASFAAVSEAMKGMTTDPDVTDVDVIAYEASMKAVGETSYFRKTPINDPKSRRDRILELVHHAATKAASEALAIQHQNGLNESDHDEGPEVSSGEVEAIAHSAASVARDAVLEVADELVIEEDHSKQPDVIEVADGYVTSSTNEVHVEPPSPHEVSEEIQFHPALSTRSRSGVSAIRTAVAVPVQDALHGTVKEPAQNRDSPFLYLDDCFDRLVPSPPRIGQREAILRHYHASKSNPPSSFHKSATAMSIKSREELVKNSPPRSIPRSELGRFTSLSTSEVRKLSIATTNVSMQQQARSPEADTIHWGSPLRHPTSHSETAAKPLQDTSAFMGFDGELERSQRSNKHTDATPITFSQPSALHTTTDQGTYAIPLVEKRSTAIATDPPPIEMRRDSTQIAFVPERVALPPLPSRDSEGNLQRLKAQLEELRLRAQKRV